MALVASLPILLLVIVLTCWLLWAAKVLLAEFPELCGAEQNLIDRTKDEAAAKKFIQFDDSV